MRLKPPKKEQLVAKNENCDSRMIDDAIEKKQSDLIGNTSATIVTVSSTKLYEVLDERLDNHLQVEKLLLVLEKARKATTVEIDKTRADTLIFFYDAMNDCGAKIDRLNASVSECDMKIDNLVQEVCGNTKEPKTRLCHS